MGKTAIQLKRVYETPSPGDGLRILVERLWPRGLTKERAAVDLWLKEIAPSPDLRKWFGHDFAKWDAFCNRYKDELDRNDAAIAQLLQLLEKEITITFVFAARDPEHNSAALLKAYVEQKA